MENYILLGKLSDQGIRAIRDAPTRNQAGRELIAQLGGRMVAMYLTMGVYDFVIFFEAPDGATMAKFLLKTGSLGNVKTEIMPAFSAAQFQEMVGTLPE